MTDTADLQVAASPGLPVPEEAHRHPVLREWPLALVISMLCVGLFVIAIHHFRWGSLAIAGATLGAALLRAALPTRSAGLLAVRSRVVDVLTMGGMGLALTVLAAVTKT